MLEWVQKMYDDLDDEYKLEEDRKKDQELSDVLKDDTIGRIADKVIEKLNKPDPDSTEPDSTEPDTSEPDLAE